MRKLLAALAVFAAMIVPVHAQNTKAQINTQIITNFPDNSIGQITPQGLRTVSSNIVNSIMPTAPVVSGNLACFNGTTGLLQDCASSPGLFAPIASPTFTGTVTIPNGSVLNTPASVTLTNATQLPVGTGISGLGTGVAAFLTTPTSANLAAAVTDEIGTGSLVFNTSPNLQTPTVGTNGGTGGTVTLNGATSGSGVVQVGAAAGAGIVFQLPAANGSNLNFLQTNGSGVTSWQGAVTSIGITPSASLSVSGSPVTSSGNITVTYRPPTIQAFTGSVTATYTTPANVSLIKVTLCGASGGGAGSGTGTTGGTGGTPAASTFAGGTLSCAGGVGGTASLAGTGSTCTGTGYIMPGKDGQAVSTAVLNNFLAGSIGGVSPLFGNQGGRGGFFNASSGAGNTGGGGGGAGCIVNYISSPAATYAYVLQGGGAAGTAGTSGAVGIIGDPARLMVEEF